jgi:hypothetical protein
MATIFSQLKTSLRTFRQQFRRGRQAREMRKAMPDLTARDWEIIDRVRPFTMLSPARLFAFMDATRHVARAGIPGSIVECGVWKGGAVMSSLLAMADLGRCERDYYLYDTFEGMPKPGDEDQKFDGGRIAAEFAARRVGESGSTWCRGEFDEVRRNILSTGYPADKIHFIRGKVEDSIPATLPGKIAVLRLDTDWYESTRHELQHLYPLLSPGGVLIVDDYGHWQGSRQAVDEYLSQHSIPMLLHRTDYTGRTGIKAA